jgi:hypothetical protein
MGYLGSHLTSTQLPKWYVTRDIFHYTGGYWQVRYADLVTAHPIQVAWNSRNANTVRSRTVASALYNMFVQAGGIISANIYRAGK